MKVTAIIPVLNEEKTIRDVLLILIASSLINEVIMVDDGSTDKTLQIAKSFKNKKLKILHLEKNVGKSEAVKAGASNIKTDILFLCDGDLRNFKEEHIQQILEPFKTEKILMSAGLRDYNFLINFLSIYFIPLVTGERALNYSLYEGIAGDPLLKGYGLEVVLNNYCQKNGIPVYKKVMHGLKQTNKPKKIKNGTFILIKQIFEIFSTLIKLRLRR